MSGTQAAGGQPRYSIVKEHCPSLVARDSSHGEKKHGLSIYRRECARSVRKTGLRFQTSDLRKRDKSLLKKELGKVKKNL